METREDIEDSNKGMMLIYGANSVIASFVLWQFSFTDGIRLLIAIINVLCIIGFGRRIQRMKKIELGEYDYLIEQDNDQRFK